MLGSRESRRVVRKFECSNASPVGAETIFRTTLALKFWRDLSYGRRRSLCGALKSSVTYVRRKLV